MNTGEMDWNEVEKVGIGALVASTIASLVAYFRSIAQKANTSDVDKKLSELRTEIDKQLEAINRRHSNWEAKSEQFATREVVHEMKAKIERMDTRLDAQLEKVSQRLDGFSVSITALNKTVEQLEKVGERLDKFIEGHR